MKHRIKMIPFFSPQDAEKNTELFLNSLKDNCKVVNISVGRGNVLIYYMENQKKSKPKETRKGTIEEILKKKDEI